MNARGIRQKMRERNGKLITINVYPGYISHKSTIEKKATLMVGYFDINGNFIERKLEKEAIKGLSVKEAGYYILNGEGLEKISLGYIISKRCTFGKGDLEDSVIGIYSEGIQPSQGEPLTEEEVK